jgi:predicted restriction endonuclease
MKLVNFASFDPTHQVRNVRGLSNASRADQAIWEEFNINPELLAYESQQAYTRITSSLESEIEQLSIPSGPTESTRLVRTRLVQSFFRDAVLSSYEYRCTICQLDLIELLNASHIIPWNRNVAMRADPRNGLALCAIHDRAFDRGLLTITESFTVRSSEKVKAKSSGELHTVALIKVDGHAIMLPKRFHPDSEALAYHREHIFKG